jgi:hypothetical protein
MQDRSAAAESGVLRSGTSCANPIVKRDCRTRSRCAADHANGDIMPERLRLRIPVRKKPVHRSEESAACDTSRNSGFHPPRLPTGAQSRQGIRNISVPIETRGGANVDSDSDGSLGGCWGGDQHNSKKEGEDSAHSDSMRRVVVAESLHVESR